MEKALEKTSNNEKVIIPPIDIYETVDEFVIKADMPGAKKEGVDVTLNDNKLEISAKVEEQENNNIKYREFRLYNYNRVFNVGSNINSAAISAKIENGVLTVNLPKREEIKPKKIEISVA